MTDFNLPESYSLEQLHAAQCQLTLDGEIVTDILKNANVKHILSFGSLLGAIRHKGFIPWDDDLDLFIYDEDYEKAMIALQTLLPKNLIIHSIKNDPNYYHCWNRIKNLKTQVEINEFYHRDNLKLKFKCLSIDLYRLSEMYFCDIESYLRKEAALFWKKKLIAGLISENEYQESPKIIEEFILNKMAKIPFDLFEPKEKVRFFCLKMVVPIKSVLFDEVKLHPFEDKHFYIPSSYKEILQSMFGDFEKIPVIENRNTRLSHYSFDQ